MLALLLLLVARRKSKGRAGGKGITASAPEGKRRAVDSAQNGAGVMDTAKIQSTGGAESPMRTGNMPTLLSPLLGPFLTPRFQLLLEFRLLVSLSCSPSWASCCDVLVWRSAGFQIETEPCLRHFERHFELTCRMMQSLTPSHSAQANGHGDMHVSQLFLFVCKHTLQT